MILKIRAALWLPGFLEINVAKNATLLLMPVQYPEPDHASSQYQHSF